MPFIEGDYKQSCPRCGFTVLASQMQYEPQTGLTVCKARCWDENIPSMIDSIGMNEEQQVDGARPKDTPNYTVDGDNGKDAL